ncbi:MAG: mechanosensitive ion channel family protein [Parcubacteria group bacterium]|nr:mechanosensitive ion channel family protein [Parcubacteria group bacterium]
MQEFLQNIINSITPWFFAHGIRIIVILVGAFIVRYFAGAMIDRIIRKAIVSKGSLSPAEEKKREDTLIGVFEGTVKVIIWAAVILMVVSELGVNIGPLLAGAGVFGLAIGFGAQYIIRDFFTGLFIILENQYRIGDVVKIGDIAGTVENINLRMTILRDIDGTVHHIPNGEIKIASNLSKEFARVNMKIGIAYDTDIEKVIKVVNQVGEEIAKDSEWKDKIIKAPEFVRIDDFADSSVIIKISGEVKPLEQWVVLGELRKQLKIAFDREGIEIPFPQRVIHQAK